MKHITKKQIAILGYQKAYKLAYQKGKRDAMKDSIPFIKMVIAPKNGFNSGVCGYWNYLDEPVEVIIFKNSKSMKTVSLELAKQLKEAGYPQDITFSGSFFYQGMPNEIEKEKGYVLLPHIALLGGKGIIKILAPTADEILDHLPHEIAGDEGMQFDLNIWKHSEKEWHMSYWWDEDSRKQSGMNFDILSGKSLVDVAARMWLYLKKMELI